MEENTLRCIAVLHHDRPVENLKWFVRESDIHEASEIDNVLFLCATTSIEELEDEGVGELCTMIDVFGKNVAEARNEIIQFCVNNGVTHLHMVDDDIEVIDTSIFEKYEALSGLLNIPYINNGFTTARNMTMVVPNPRVKCAMGRFGVEDLVESVIFNPHVVNGFNYRSLHYCK